MKRLLILPALLAAGCVADAGSEPPRSAGAPPAVLAERGERIALRTCSRCHAMGFDGAGPNAAAPALRTVAERYNQVALRDQLHVIADKGHFEMPARQFTHDEIPDLVAYIDSLTRPPGT